MRFGSRAVSPSVRLLDIAAIMAALFLCSGSFTSSRAQVAARGSASADMRELGPGIVFETIPGDARASNSMMGRLPGLSVGFAPGAVEFTFQGRRLANFESTSKAPPHRLNRKATISLKVRRIIYSETILQNGAPMSQTIIASPTRIFIPVLTLSSTATVCNWSTTFW